MQFGDFETFLWIPVVIDGNLYHFEQHKEEKLAFKWTNMEGQIEVDEIADFNIKVTRTKKDFISKRKDIPKELQITSASNNLDITLVSKGEQVGHGNQFPKGLAYYRQSLLVSSKKSKGNGYGMLELIIENN